MTQMNVGVTGATNNIGREILNLLASREFDLDEIFALESGNEALGQQVSFGDEDILDVKNLKEFNFENLNILFHAGNIHEAEEIALKCLKHEVLMIDCSGFYNLDADVEAIVPEVNADKISKRPRRMVIANPTCSAILLALSLKPIHEVAKVKRVVANVLEPVSIYGRLGQDELFSQTKALFMNTPKEPHIFEKTIAFNLIPFVGDEMEDGQTIAEFQTIANLKKVLGSEVKIAASHTITPAFAGVSMNVNIECEEELSAIKASLLMSTQKGMGVTDDRTAMPTPKDMAGEDLVYAARIRDDISAENALSYWLCGDNIGKGSALNAVQIAEHWMDIKGE